MAKLKPWYQVVTPRKDLRENRPMDASEFAVHLDHIREKRDNVSADYLDPARFFERTYLTGSLLDLASQVVRRWFWKLAQSLSALYPKETDEKCWVDGVLARKKGLGL